MAPLRPFTTRCRCLLAGLLLGAASLAPAWELQGTKTILAHTRDQQTIELGTVRFEAQGDITQFVVTMAYGRFTDHFLSMKEFKCLEGAEVVCHVPYPYRQPHTVSAHDLTWLEHNLLFLYKLPTDFGAKLWNGLYFRLERTEHGLLGKPQAIDLNYISAPSDQPDVPPYQPALRDDIAPGARWITSLTIE